MGRTYDEFDFGETIGVGTVGTIYEVTERATGRQYALKLLSPAVSTDETVVARFEREMLILSKLNHANIVGYHGNGQHDSQLFYVMELIRGGTLKDVLQRSGPLSWEEAAECGRQIAAALQHAHNHGIIHRDLKPGNVFFTVEGTAKLGDFGIARDMRATDLTDTGLTVGTYAYMPPELVRGSRDITGLVDLYALGCVLHEMVTGRPPYRGDNFAEIFDQHLTAEPPSVRAQGVDCPEAFERLIVRLLAKSPEDRPFNARAVQGLLGELLDVDVKPSIAGKHDRAAASVRPAQMQLRHRILASAITAESPEISWAKIGVLGLIVAIAIAALAILNR